MSSHEQNPISFRKAAKRKSLFPVLLEAMQRTDATSCRFHSLLNIMENISHGDIYS
jgi:hypothetical protein